MPDGAERGTGTVKPLPPVRLVAQTRLLASVNSFRFPGIANWGRAACAHSGLPVTYRRRELANVALGVKRPCSQVGLLAGIRTCCWTIGR